MTLTPIAERLAVELLLPFFRLGSVAAGFEHPTFGIRGKRSNRLRHRRREFVIVNDEHICKFVKKINSYVLIFYFLCEPTEKIREDSI